MQLQPIDYEQMLQNRSDMPAGNYWDRTINYLDSNSTGISPLAFEDQYSLGSTAALNKISQGVTKDGKS